MTGRTNLPRPWTTSTLATQPFGAGMPILAAEPDLYPTTLFDADADGRVWWVAQTRPRQEKALARDLIDVQVPYFSPSTPRRNRVRGRIVESHIPLFPGYVFIRGTAAERNRVRTSRRVVRMLDVADQATLGDDLRQVRCLTGTGLPLEPASAVQGSRVRIRSGPMAGLTGSVLRSAGRQRFVVSVEFLGAGVAVELGSDALAGLPSRRTAGASA